MTELSFLIDLLLNHKLPKVTRDAIATRIKTVEGLSFHGQVSSAGIAGRNMGISTSLPINLPPQAPSTMAILERNPDLAQKLAETTPPAQPEVIAQTPAAMAALEARRKMMAGEKDATGKAPKKFLNV